MIEIDISPIATEQAQVIAARLGIADRASFLVVSAEHLAIFPFLLRFLDGLDEMPFHLPGMRYQEWMSVLVLAKPKKG